MVSARRNTVRVCEYVRSLKSRTEDIVNKPFLSLTFNKKVEADQRKGLPPTIFFSHNSERV